MSTTDNTLMYALKIKGKDGKWYTVPTTYQTIYNVYKDYCTANNLVAVDLNTFYGVFQTFAQSTLLEQLQKAFTENGSALPIDLGGTGATDSETARANLRVYSIDEIDEKLNIDGETPLAEAFENIANNFEQINKDITDIINEIDELPKSVTLKSLGVTIGEAAPDSNTSGEIYFKY